MQNSEQFMSSFLNVNAFKVHFVPTATPGIHSKLETSLETPSAAHPQAHPCRKGCKAQEKPNPRLCMGLGQPSPQTLPPP